MEVGASQINCYMHDVIKWNAGIPPFLDSLLVTSKCIFTVMAFLFYDELSPEKSTLRFRAIAKDEVRKNLPDKVMCFITNVYVFCS